MYTLELASGAVHEATMCGESDGYLVIGIQDGASWKAVSDEFANPENTRKITYRYGEMKNEYMGYTQPVFMRWDGGGKYHISLKFVREGKDGANNAMAE